MMKDLEDKSLQFVLDNYKKGMFDTRKALEKITKEKPVKQSRNLFMYYASGLVASVIDIGGRICVLQDLRRTGYQYRIEQ